MLNLSFHDSWYKERYVKNGVFIKRLIVLLFELVVNLLNSIVDFLQVSGNLILEPRMRLIEFQCFLIGKRQVLKGFIILLLPKSMNKITFQNTQ